MSLAQHLSFLQRYHSSFLLSHSFYFPSLSSRRKFNNGLSLPLSSFSNFYTVVRSVSLLRERKRKTRGWSLDIFPAKKPCTSDGPTYVCWMCSRHGGFLRASDMSFPCGSLSPGAARQNVTYVSSYQHLGLLSRTQAGPSRAVKEQHKQTSPNHVQGLFLSSV